MAAAIREHPNEAVLRAYTQGRLPLADAAELDRHIESCGECVRTLESIGSDTFSDLLRQPQTPFEGTKTPPREDVPAELRNHPRYEIGAHLGRGGMGVVYKAEHRMMRRPVALKLIRPDLLASPAAVERFRREVQAAAKLAHPNIVTAHDAEEVAGVHFLVMEFVEGRTLDRVVAKRGPLPANIACSLARQAALGLDHAHAHGMVHRDIKPQNLIVTPKSKVKILDFGLAMWTGPRTAAANEKSGETTALGTLLFAAPEQLHAKSDVDARADQYGLGATLYYLLTGEPPRRPADDANFKFEDLPFPNEVPEGVRDVVHKLLSNLPSDRYPNAKAVADALTPHCRGSLPVESPPRRQIAFRMALAAFLLLSALTVYGLTRDRKVAVLPPASSGQVEKKEVVEKKEKLEPVWQSLLTGFVPHRTTIYGNWQMIDGELTVKAAQGARIGIRYKPPEEYDIRVSFTRHTGMHSVGVVILHGGNQVLFELDAWEQHLGGFQDIGGKTLIDNPTRTEHCRLDNGRRYTMQVEVRRGLIRGFFDGREIARHATDGSDLSVNEEYWDMRDKTIFGLTSWNGEAVFHSVEIRPFP